MPRLLHIDSSPLGKASISRELSAEFVANWKRTHPDGTIIRRDLAATSIPVVSAEWIAASFTPEASRTPAQRDELSISDTLIAELEAADECAIGIPMHNFTVAAPARLWIDQIVRAGRTFAFVEGSAAGLLKNKKATFLIASGGIYKLGSPMASFDFVEPYLRAIFGLMGVTDVHFLTAGGVAAIRFGKIDRTTFLQPHIAAIREQFASV